MTRTSWGKWYTIFRFKYFPGHPEDNTKIPNYAHTIYLYLDLAKNFIMVRINYDNLVFWYYLQDALAGLVFIFKFWRRNSKLKALIWTQILLKMSLIFRVSWVQTNVIKSNKALLACALGLLKQKIIWQQKNHLTQIKLKWY